MRPNRRCKATPTFRERCRDSVAPLYLLVDVAGGLLASGISTLAFATRGNALPMYSVGPYAFGVMSRSIGQESVGVITALMCVVAALLM